KHCRARARFELSGLDPMPAGMPKIEVTFLIDANGVLRAQAKELRTGKAAAIEVRPTYGLTEAEVERMVEESFAYAEADVEARLLIETRNEADTVITHVERALRQGGELVSGDERESIRAALEELRRVRAAADREQIREKTTALGNNIDLQHNCGGKCACTTCHVIVRSAAENLSKMEEDEEDRLDTAEGLTLHSRLGCQAVVGGDVVVEIPPSGRGGHKAPD